MKNIQNSKDIENDFIIELDHKIRSLALKKKKKILITEAWDERALLAAFEVQREGIADIILLGSKDKIMQQAQKLNLDISNMQIVDPKTYNLYDKEKLIEQLVQLRSYKGLTKEEAAKLLENDNYFGCMLVYAGIADAIAGSCICPTGDLIRPALQILNSKKTKSNNIPSLFSIFIFKKSHNLFQKI